MDYEILMRKCFKLAKKGKTSPNPMVGCVVLDENNNLISEGYHRKYGENHAERDALLKLKNNEVENVYMAFKESINEHKKEMNLRNKDFEILLDLSKSLGETNVEGQIKIFNLAKEKLDIELEIAEDECNKNTKVYRYLGVAVGAMIAIFLV